MSNIAVTVEEINKINPLDIVYNEIVRQRFILIYDTLWGQFGSGEMAYQKESKYFNDILINDNKKVANSTKFSIFTAFLDLAICGLSLEPGVRALCYLQGKSFNIGKDANNKDIWEGRLMLVVSGYGELVQRERAGQIRHADNPICVYDNDEFSFSDNNGAKTVNYTCHLPHTGRKLVACFMKITRTDGTYDYGILLEEDWLRLRDYSYKQNHRVCKDGSEYGSANALYGDGDKQIDTGFLCAKCIKHAFKTYPKVRTGKGTLLETQQPDEPNIDDMYNVDTQQHEQPAMPQDVAPAYGPAANDVSAGVTVDPANTPDAEDDGAF